MPLTEDLALVPPFWHRNGHLQSILPSLWRQLPFSYARRERLELADGDFLDLDWSVDQPSSSRLVIITHGLEGDASRHYVTGMASLFTKAGYDALGWNCRSCSGELNRLPRFYHHGDASDLQTVVNHALQKGYAELVLVGFSMGGSLTFRALAEDPHWAPSAIKAAIGFSVPCSLKGSVDALSRPGTGMYRKRFLRKLGVKIKAKALLFPDHIDATGYDKIKWFEEFDDRYTAPLHGYTSAADFYEKASVGPHLHKLNIPSLLVQAANDPFLLDNCFPRELAAQHDWLHVEITQQGGHCGFMEKGKVFSWAEARALAFAEQFTKA
ncbi:MAG: alpha/beta fold hydrolase [Sphingobacteriia bacterium]|nr:MAG: alpha/beta fold hydrolase [Sphingobacteriia bacterium]